MNPILYRGHLIRREINGNSRRWHVYSTNGEKLTRLGYRSKRAAMDFIRTAALNVR